MSDVVPRQLHEISFNALSSPMNWELLWTIVNRWTNKQRYRDMKKLAKIIQLTGDKSQSHPWTDVTVFLHHRLCGCSSLSKAKRARNIGWMNEPTAESMNTSTSQRSSGLLVAPRAVQNPCPSPSVFLMESQGYNRGRIYFSSLCSWGQVWSSCWTSCITESKKKKSADDWTLSADCSKTTVGTCE